MTTDEKPKRAPVRTGWALARTSWRTLRADPELLWPALWSLVIIAAACVVDVIVWGGMDRTFAGPVLVVAARNFPLMVVAHSATVVATAVIVAGARIRLAGGEPTLDSAWRIVSRRLPHLVAFGILQACERTVTFVLSSFKRPGQWLADLIDAAWDFATFLAVPVLLFEGSRGPFAATRRSASLVRTRWGAQLTAQATIGAAVFLACLPVAVAAGVACGLGFGAVGVWTVVIVGLVVIDVVSHALSAVLSAALYRYLVTGHLSAGYDEADLRAVFADKPAKD
jgi:hypothetical protein